jgi:hypothetical protein
MLGPDLAGASASMVLEHVNAGGRREPVVVVEIAGAQALDRLDCAQTADSS